MSPERSLIYALTLGSYVSAPAIEDDDHVRVLRVLADAQSEVSIRNV